jgi:hypothetical protein
MLVVVVVLVVVGVLVMHQQRDWDQGGKGLDLCGIAIIWSGWGLCRSGSISSCCSGCWCGAGWSW